MQHLRSHREAALLQPEATQVATFAAFGHRLAAQADEEDEEMYKTLAKTLAVQVIIPPFHIAHPSPTPSGWCDPASQWCVPSPLAVQDVLETLLDAEVTHPPALLWVVCPPSPPRRFAPSSPSAGDRPEPQAAPPAHRGGGARRRRLR